MSVLKHLTLGNGWGGYTLAPDGRGGGAYRETQKRSPAEDRVYEALLKRLEEETAQFAETAPVDAAAPVESVSEPAH